MGDRRMITSKVYKFPKFKRLSQGAKLLYTYMTLDADEDGVNFDVETDMVYANATNEDLASLIESEYLMVLAEDIYLIKHFPMANTFRADRKKDPQFPKLMKKVRINTNSKDHVYEWVDGQMTDKCLSNDGQTSDKCPHNLTKPNLTQLNSTKHNITETSIIDTIDGLKAFMRGKS